MLKTIILIVAGLIFIEAVSLLFIVRSIKTFRNFWLAEAVATTADNAIKYYALGDSTAQGIGATTPRNGYVGLLANRIEEKSGKAVHVINLSKSGAGIEDVIDNQLPALKKLKPDPEAIITLAIGANDLAIHDEKWFSEKYAELFKQLPKRTVIADLPYFGGGRHRSLENKVERVNQMLISLAAENSLQLAHLHEITKKQDSLLVYSADFFHPSNIGYKNWSQAFWDADVASF
jgi:acyl-CoA thioesterase-1